MSDDKKPEPIKIQGMDAFKTREASNTGIRVALRLPTGQETDQWMQILGFDSDAFQEAADEGRRRRLEAAAKSGKDGAPESRPAQREDGIRLTAAAVGAWSFEAPCTLDNVAAFLRDAPHIVEQIDAVVFNRAAFFAERLRSLLDGQSQNCASTDAPQEASKV
jgi:hypothetical protein